MSLIGDLLAWLQGGLQGLGEAVSLRVREEPVERLIAQAQRRLARCFACGTDGAFPATITSHLGRSGSTRASIRICARCWERATLPEARAAGG